MAEDREGSTEEEEGGEEDEEVVEEASLGEGGSGPK